MAFIMSKEITESIFSPYTDLGIQEYLGLLLCLNESYLEKTRAQLNSLSLFADLNTNLAVLAVGSDGKQERHPRSRIELVLVSDQHSLELDQVASQLDLASEAIGLDNQRIGGTEVKILTETVSYYKGQKYSVYPDRVINSILVSGNPEIHLQAREKALEEISSPTPSGQALRSKMKKQLHEYYKASQSGIYRNIPAFSLFENKQFYHEGSDYLVTGFKIPFLRSVQRMLDLLTIEIIKQKIMSPNEATEVLPTMTANRIELLSDLGLLNNQEQLVQAYVWFLQQYHYIQENNKSNPLQLSSLEFDVNKFNNHSLTIKNAIEEFMKKVL